MDDASDVEAAVRLYIDSWYRGEADGMARSLHDELVKRSVERGEEPRGPTLAPVTKAQMVEATKAGGGDAPDTDVEVAVDHDLYRRRAGDA